MTPPSEVKNSPIREVKNSPIRGVRGDDSPIRGVKNSPIRGEELPPSEVKDSPIREVKNSPIRGEGLPHRRCQMMTPPSEVKNSPIRALRNRAPAANEKEAEESVTRPGPGDAARCLLLCTDLPPSSADPRRPPQTPRSSEDGSIVCV
uniref:Uncharacterized protein n=1 Tax=Knipowitschia caucasica TaxID=637954 RepID=A0AAV2M345_KNICA